MCGIFGIVQTGLDNIENKNLNQMQNSIKHRGPDHSGQYINKGAAIGVNRLSIIDLSAGNQPIYNEDGSLVIVYNGEVYNHLEIRDKLNKKGHVFKSHSDTETVLHAFEEYGEDCLKLFNGMFAFAIWNNRKNQLFLARDRLGIKPLYITDLDDGLAFASEAKALLEVLPGTPQPDWTAIYRYFSFGYIPTPESPFAGISKFPPGHFAWFNGKDINKTCYWKPDYEAKSEVNIVSASSTVLELLENAVKIELMSDVPVGVFLSGGLDSSAVALFAAKHSKQKVKSFGVRFEESTHDESADSRLVARHLGLDHHEFFFSNDMLSEYLSKVTDILDEPFGDSTALPLLALSEFAREHVKVVLTGWGGDEIFAGYPTYKAHKLAQFYRKLPASISKKLIPSVASNLPVSSKYMSFEFKAKRFIKGMDMPPEIQHFLWMGYFDDLSLKQLFRANILEQVQGETYDPVYDILNGLNEKDIISRIMHLDAKFFLEGNGLFQADRMTMASSLEARVPLLNINLLDYVNSLPVSIKMNGGKTKSLLRKALKKHLPEKILNKPKKGFGPPSSAWIRGPLSDTFNRLFSKESVEDVGIFEFDMIRQLLNNHHNRKADHGRELWVLLSFQLWYNKFILSKGV